jgi:general secretion pathway protein H
VACNLIAPPSPQTGFTLVELLMVLALIATCTTLLTLSLPEADHTRLQRDAQRLAAQLDAARAQSRASGQALWWQPTANGYRFLRQTRMDSPPRTTTQNPWLDPEVRMTQGPESMLLGPEPVIQAYQLELTRGNQRLRLASDGVGPFGVQPGTP